MKRQRRKQERGQALVEMALGSLIFVTVLMFGIYFAEVSFLSLKVEEAANFALFDATSKQMHNMNDLSGSVASRWSLYQPNAVTPAGPNATTRYRDFDGRTGTNTGTTFSQALTRAQGLNVDCDTAPGIPRPLIDNATAFGQVLPTGNSGMRCRAGATLVAIQIPRTFVENNLFKEQHLRDTAFRVCAGGRAVGGQCQRRYSILLDDWGFSRPAESGECHLRINGPGNNCGNRGFYDLAERIFIANGSAQGSDGSALANTIAGFSPIDENQFFMSFRGGESNYEETVNSHVPGGNVWDTTPALVSGYPERPGNCFLGHGC